MEIVSEMRGDVLFARMKGQIDMLNSMDLRQFVNQSVENGHYKVVLDFKAITYLDSSGLGVLVYAARSFKDKGGDLILCGVRPKIEQIISLNLLASFVQMLPNDEEAIKAFNKA